jgi:hypothetical protein
MKFGASERDKRWTNEVSRRAKLIHDEIASLQRWVSESSGSDELLDDLCRPYYELLEQLYEEELPIASAKDHSDFLLHYEGPAVLGPNPKISVVARAIDNVRKQVTNVAKAIAELEGALDSAHRLPAELDLEISGFARGSLYLGFRLPSAQEISAQHGQNLNLFGADDQLYNSVKRAIRTIGVAVAHVTVHGSTDGLQDEIDDPKVRDCALTALENLAPSRKSGIETVRIGGRALEGLNVRPLTFDVHNLARRVLKTPVAGELLEAFEGVVREIDLDDRRFELRGIQDEQVDNIRCAYSDSIDDVEAKAWLNVFIRVTGNVEKSPRGRPRLIQVHSVEVID